MVHQITHFVHNSEGNLSEVAGYGYERSETTDRDMSVGGDGCVRSADGNEVTAFVEQYAVSGRLAERHWRADERKSAFAGRRNGSRSGDRGRQGGKAGYYGSGNGTERDRRAGKLCGRRSASRRSTI